MHRSVCTSPFTKEVETEWRNGKLEEGVDCPPTTYLSQCNFSKLYYEGKINFAKIEFCARLITHKKLN